MDQVPEQKVAEGIYMTDFRKKPTVDNSTFTMQEEYENLLATTHFEIKEITNKIFHLERSNREMKEIDPEGQDEDLVIAVSENLVVLEKFRKRLDLINERLAQLQLNCLKIDTSAPSSHSELMNAEGDITDEMIDNIYL